MSPKSNAFTMIEVALTIALLGILVVSALPMFMNITTQARQASRDGVAGAVQSGVHLYRTNDLLTNGAPGNYPTTLDNASNAPCSNTNLCFGTVLSQGINDSNWSKSSSASYVYNDGTDTFTYTYNAATGAFTSP